MKYTRTTNTHPVVSPTFTFKTRLTSTTRYVCVCVLCSPVSIYLHRNLFSLRWIWGLDIYATVIHDVLPQKTKEDKSPYERRTGKKPDLNKLFIKVFGAPCQYSPMTKPEHKRANW